MSILAGQLKTIRTERGLTQRALGELAHVDRLTVGALEAGEGNMPSLEKVAGALGFYVTPLASSLGNCRRWRRLSGRALAAMAGTTHKTVAALESGISVRVVRFEALCSALNEVPRLVRREPVWSTPRHIIEAVLAGLGIKRFDLDVASPPVPCVPCRRWYTEADGALWFPWDGAHVWANPPYASHELPRFVDKAICEHRAGRATTIAMLIPYAVNTQSWWHLIEAGGSVYVLRGRLRFGERTETARLPSAIVVLGDAPSMASHLPAHHRVTAALEGA